MERRIFLGSLGVLALATTLPNYQEFTAEQLVLIEEWLKHATSQGTQREEGRSLLKEHLGTSRKRELLAWHCANLLEVGILYPGCRSRARQAIYVNKSIILDKLYQSICTRRELKKPAFQRFRAALANAQA